MLWLVSIVPMACALPILSAGSANRSRLAAFSVAALLLSLAVGAAAVHGNWQASWPLAPAFGLTASLEPFNAVLVLLAPAVALPVALYAAAHERKEGLARLVALLVLFVGAMELLVVAADFLTLFIAWELVGACSWALIAHEWRTVRNVRGATRAFLVTRCGDLGLLLATMAVWSDTGSFAFENLRLLDGRLLHLAAAGIVVSAAAKSAQLPFSFWLFRAMAGPTSASALLHAAAMVAAGAYLLLRLQPFLDAAGWFAPALLAIGLATALSGGIVATLQSNSKKLLAASTSAHFGLMFAATGAGFPAVALLHLVTHAFVKSLLFLAAGVAATASGTLKLSRGRLGRALPKTAAAAAIGTAALAGVPPLAAAMSKDLVVAAVGDLGHWLALCAMFAGALSACYAFRAFWLTFGPPAGGRSPVKGEPGATVHLALAVPAAVTLVLSLLWLPPVKSAVERWLEAPLPHVAGWELAASVLLVGLGLHAGRWLADARPALGEAAPLATAAEWFGLERLGEVSIGGPVLRLARGAAALDDAVLDGVPRAIAKVTRKLAAWLDHGDDAVVDAGVRRAAALGAWLAAAASRYAEAVADGAVQGAAWLADRAGVDLRHTETGLVHHYLAIAAGGALIIVATAAMAMAMAAGG